MLGQFPISPLDHWNTASNFHDCLVDVGGDTAHFPRRPRQKRSRAIVRSLTNSFQSDSRIALDIATPPAAERPTQRTVPPRASFLLPGTNRTGRNRRNDSFDGGHASSAISWPPPRIAESARTDGSGRRPSFASAGSDVDSP